MNFLLQIMKRLKPMTKVTGKQWRTGGNTGNIVRINVPQHTPVHHMDHLKIPDSTKLPESLMGQQS